jgi:uncharacterized protein YjbJ (UPF0337 family)
MRLRLIVLRAGKRSRLGQVPWRLDGDAAGAHDLFMNKDQGRGIADNVKGRLKEAVGVLTGNKSQEAEGSAERAKGTVEKAIGDGKHDVAKKLTTNSSAKDRDEGVSQNAKGRVKQAEGILAGDKSLEREGVADRATGAAKNAVEDVKDAVHRVKRDIARKLEE